MSGNSDYIQHPKTKELAVAKLDIAKIFFECYEKDMSAKEAIQECKRLGAAEVTIDEVENAYRRLSASAQWLNELVLSYLRTKDNV